MMNAAKLSKYVSILCRREQTYMKYVLKEAGLGYTSYKFLLFISDHAGCSQRDICESMMLDESLATRTVETLQAGGYVRRERTGRTYELSLTEKGTTLLPHILDALTKWWESLTGELAENETELLSKQLERLAKIAIHEIKHIEAGCEN